MTRSYQYGADKTLKVQVYNINNSKWLSKQTFGGRNNEYYNSQEIQDKLYKYSQEGYDFKNLMEHITSRKNISLAYRNIKRNKGSRTRETNNTTIEDLEK